MNREEAEKYLYCAMDIGEQLLICGAEVGRVEDTIRRICMAYGAVRVDVFSITSSIVTTMYRGDMETCTQTRRVSQMSTDLHKVDRLNQLSRRICEEKPRPEEITEALYQIKNEPGYSFWKQVLIYGLVSGAFSVFFGGNGKDMIVSAVIGILLNFLEFFVFYHFLCRYSMIFLNYHTIFAFLSQIRIDYRRIPAYFLFLPYNRRIPGIFP